MFVQEVATNLSKYLLGIEDFTHRRDALKFRQNTDTDLPRLEFELGKSQNHCVKAMFAMNGHSGSIMGCGRPVPK